jgi:hypothetical protein
MVLPPFDKLRAPSKAEEREGREGPPLPRRMNFPP